MVHIAERLAVRSEFSVQHLGCLDVPPVEKKNSAEPQVRTDCRQEASSRRWTVRGATQHPAFSRIACRSRPRPRR